MSKNINNESEVTIFIVDELSEDKKTTFKSLLKIPYKHDKTHKALRVYEKEQETNFFVSSRNGLIKTDDGFECDVTHAVKFMTGKKFELSEVGSRKIVLYGKIAVKKVDAEIIDIKKTGTDGK